MKGWVNRSAAMSWKPFSSGFRQKKRVATPVTQASTGAAVQEKEVRNAELTMQGCGFTTSSSLPHRGWIMKTNHDPDSFMQFHTEFVKKKMPQSGIFYFC